METVAKKNVFAWFVAYVRESKEELEKVIWPSKEAAIRYAILVIGVSVAMAAFFAALDLGLTKGLEKLIELKTNV